MTCLSVAGLTDWTSQCNGVGDERLEVQEFVLRERTQVDTELSTTSSEGQEDRARVLIVELRFINDQSARQHGDLDYIVTQVEDLREPERPPQPASSPPLEAGRCACPAYVDWQVDRRIVWIVGFVVQDVEVFVVHWFSDLAFGYASKAVQYIDALFAVDAKDQHVLLLEG